MKKIFLLLIIVPMLICIGACSNANSQTTNTTQNSSSTVFATETDDVWTPTFQLCWNELINFLGTPTVEYINGNPKLADELNKQKFTKSDLNPNDYLVSVTKQTLKHKKELEKAIKQKFNEKSDILSQFNFPNIPDNKTSQWFIYSILIKNFPFSAAFDVLPNGYFDNKKDTEYKYFGFDVVNSSNKENQKKLSQHITPLFYANNEDFALSITDKSDQEEMILYLTDSDKSFDEIFEEIKEKTSHSEEYTQTRIQQAKHGEDVEVVFNNYYKFPYLEIDRTLNFDDELTNKPIKSTKGETFVISKTIQTIKFHLDNNGAKLKSEAAISIKATAMRPLKKITIMNNYYFDRPFVIYLKEINKDKPYFAAKVKDGKYLVKAK